MTLLALTNLLIKIVSGYSRKNEIKELCISLGESGDIKIGGRTMLISEIKEEQPYVETAGCIQVVFAASSDSVMFDKNHHCPKLIDELQQLLKTEKDCIEMLPKLSIENFINIAPKLEKLSITNQW